MPFGIDDAAILGATLFGAFAKKPKVPSVWDQLSPEQREILDLYYNTLLMYGRAMGYLRDNAIDVAKEEAKKALRKNGITPTDDDVRVVLGYDLGAISRDTIGRWENAAPGALSRIQQEVQAELGKQGVKATRAGSGGLVLKDRTGAKTAYYRYDYEFDLPDVPSPERIYEVSRRKALSGIGEAYREARESLELDLARRGITFSPSAGSEFAGLAKEEAKARAGAESELASQKEMLDAALYQDLLGRLGAASQGILSFGQQQQIAAMQSALERPNIGQLLGQVGGQYLALRELRRMRAYGGGDYTPGGLSAISVPSVPPVARITRFTPYDFSYSGR